MIYPWPFFYFQWTDAVVDFLPEVFAHLLRHRELPHQHALELRDAVGVRGLVEQREDVGPYPKVEAVAPYPLVESRVVVLAVSVVGLLAHEQQHDQRAALEVVDVHSARDSVHEEVVVHTLEASVHFLFSGVFLFKLRRAPPAVRRLAASWRLLASFEADKAAFRAVVAFPVLPIYLLSFSALLLVAYHAFKVA